MDMEIFKGNIFEIEKEKNESIKLNLILSFFALIFIMYINFFKSGVVNLDFQFKIIFELIFYSTIFYILYNISNHFINKIEDKKVSKSIKNNLILILVLFLPIFIFIEINLYKINYKKDYNVIPEISILNENLNYTIAEKYSYYLKKNSNKSFSSLLNKKEVNTGAIYYLNHLSYSEGLDFLNFKNNYYDRRDGDIFRAYILNKY